MENLELKQMRKTARKAAQREGYDQVIIQVHDGSLSVSRAYPGCCPVWYGKVVEEFKVNYTPTGVVIKRYKVEDLTIS